MAHKKITGVQQLATGTGTGALTLGAVASPLYRTMQAAGMADADTAYVMIRHATIPTEWEIVLATYTASGTTITPSFDSKSVSATGALIDFSAGSKIVSEARHDGVDWITDRGTAPVNVVNFIDDASDVLAAFEAAIAINGSIFIPAGTYVFSAAWEIAARQISVVGEARGLVILKFEAGGIVADIPASLTTDIYASVTFKNLTIMTDAAGTSTGLKLLASTPTNVHPTLDNLEFIGSDGALGPSQTVTGTSHTSTTIDGIASTAGILVNSTCEGSGVPRSTYVTAVGANSVTLNQATTSSVTSTFFFNSGPLKYWDVGIDLDGAWFPSITNIRVSGGGAGKTTAGIYIHAGSDVAMFDYFLSHIEINYCTTALLITGQVEGLMLSQFDFYTSRDGIVATNPGSLSVGTWQISDGTIYCSRNPISIDHFSSIQINNVAPTRGVGENAWNPAAGGVSYDGPNGGFLYAGTNVSIVGATDRVQLTSLMIYNPSLITTNGIYLEDVDVFMINGVNFLTGVFTNGLNFQGTTSKGSFDNIVAYGDITNPVVYGTTGYIRAGSFTHNDNDAAQWSDARTAFSANDATPSVKPLYGKNYFYTANSNPTTITAFDDAIPGQIFRVLINDTNTTLAHSATLLLDGGINCSPPNGAVLTFLQEGTTYAREIGRLLPTATAVLTDARTAFSVNDATPSVFAVQGRSSFYTQNTNPTTIAQFDDATVGQIWRVIIADDNTTLAHGATILMQGGVDYSPLNGTVLTFQQEGGGYAREISRLTYNAVASTFTAYGGSIVVTPTSTSAISQITIEGGSASGYGALEIGGGAGAYIDLKAPSSDDFDVRFFTDGSSSASIVSASGIALTFGAGGVGNSVSLSTNNTARQIVLDDQVYFVVGISGTEISTPAAPAANGWIMYGEDNGAGKTRLMVRFASGASQQIAIEP